MISKITYQPPRYAGGGGLFFLTFCTFKRTRILHDNGIPQLLLRNFDFYKKLLNELIAYTIMPDHIHLLVEVDDVQQISSFLRDFKKQTSKEIKKIVSLNHKYIWQRGTMDHRIRFGWTNSDLQNHVQYLFYNSWKHLNILPKEFPYHNFEDIVNRGWLEADFFDFTGSQSQFNIYE